MLGCQIALATGLPTKTIAWGAGSSLDANLGDVEISAIYADFGAPQSIDGWAALYDHAAPSATLDAMAQQHFAGALVIGFELPPVVQRALLRHGATIIDACVHPVRFLDDIFLAFRASEPLLLKSLVRHAVREDFLGLMAGVQGAAAVTKSSFTPEQESLIFFDQTPDDAVRIAGGQFMRIDAFRDALVSTAAGFAKVYFKRHPCAPMSKALATLREWGIAAEEIDENAYCLMAHPNVRGVLSLSSSAGAEAVYFGKEKPNRLRLSLNAFWGFNQIDSDGYIAAAMQAGSALASQTEKLAAFDRWLTDEAIYRNRSLLGRLLFRHNGRLTRGLMRALFHKNGEPREFFRSWIIGKDGVSRKFLQQWMSSKEYLGLPRAYRGGVLR